MICLSKKGIEVIGEAVLEDYAARLAHCAGNPIKIDVFARNHLKLNIEYRKLSDDGRILGVTTYAGVVLELIVGGQKIEVTVPGDTVLLEKELFKPENEARRRFTLAHECAHQILARLQEKQTGYSFRREFEAGKRYTYNQVKTIEDWSEWQANALAAVLLMSKSSIAPHFTFAEAPRKMTSYDGRLRDTDYAKVKMLAREMMVSISALTIRLNDLGYVTRKPGADPLDIVAG